MQLMKMALTTIFHAFRCLVENKQCEAVGPNCESRVVSNECIYRTKKLVLHVSPASASQTLPYINILYLFIATAHQSSRINVGEI